MKRYIITDVHEMDAYYLMKKELIGREIIPMEAHNRFQYGRGWKWGNFIVDDEMHVFHAIKYKEVKG